MEAVEISAGDLRLRPWRPADVPAVERACQDPGLRPWAAEARHFVTELAPAMLADGTAVPLAIFDARSGELLGSSDLRALDLLHKTADPEIVRWFGVLDPYFDADARRYIQRDAPQEWARGTEAIFVVAGPGDTYAGSVDLRISAHDPAAGEIGFLIAPPARGRGYATAAVRALTAWGFAELGLARIQWRAEVGNAASRRVAEKAGFTMEGRLRSGHAENGIRRDCWIASLLAVDAAGGGGAGSTDSASADRVIA